MSVFYFGKRATLSVFICFLLAVIVSARHNQSGYLAFRTTRVKDPKLTLAVVSFQVGLNNSLFF